MNQRKPLIMVATMALSLGMAVSATARDYISIVGSSTVYPFSTTVAEQFGKTTRFKTPKVESTGSGGGLKLFCSGVGVTHPDITNASRRIKKSEYDMCGENGVNDIIEVKVGYDGIVFANAKKVAQLNLSRRDIYLALAKDVPNPADDSSIVANPYKTWKDVSGDLPAINIEVLGPPPTSGTRDAFVELIMDVGCEEFPAIASLKKSDKNKFKALCQTVREDGAFIEAGENDNLIVQKLEANPNAFGIFGFSFLDQNSDKVQGAIVDGKQPTFESIADGSYPVSRPLYFYVKKAHIGTIPGIVEFLAEFSSDRAWGDEGYLSDKGLIPMPQEERSKFAADIQNQTSLVLK